MTEKREIDSDDRPTKRPRTEEPTMATPQLTQDDQERAVGITVYVSPGTPGFKCTVKHRYTDFLVNEILPGGEVLHLTDLGDAKRKKHNAAQAPASNGSQDAPVAPTETSVPAASKLEPAVVEPSVSEHTEPTPSEETLKADSHGNGEAANEQQDAPADALAELSLEDQQTMNDIFGEATVPKIRSLYATVLKHPHRKARDHPTVQSEVISEKSKRTDAHSAIRRIFDSKLQTETLQDQPGVIAIKASPPPGKAASGARGQHTGRDTNGPATKGKIGWSDMGGEYLHFTLHKENKDTMEVLFFIASQLKVPAKNFQFAGTKDRRGVTVQKVAVFRVYAERVAALNRMAKGWVASGFEYKKHGLELGELTGNEFLLTLRDCHFDGEDGLDTKARLGLAKDVVSKAADSFRDKGYLNYYGLQRFGSFSTGTHMVGVKMLQGDLEGAVNSILTYSPDLLPENQSASDGSKVPQDDINRADVIRQWRQTGRWHPDFQYKIPRRFQAESLIMQYLGRKDKRSGRMLNEHDWQGALMQIQRGLRLMYVHAYQSLVWNTVAGKRWELHGDKVVEGDLVIVGEKDEDATAAPKEEVDEDGEPIVRPAPDDSAPTSADDFTRARPLSAAEAASGKYNIFDIALPQPGWDVVYPANELGEFYKSFMGSEEGGGLDPGDMRRKWKDVSLSGGYRKMMARPLGGSVEWRVEGYGKEEQQMVETDVERLRRVRREERDAEVPKEAMDGVGGAASSGEVGEEEKNRIAVVMKFQLGSSQYATMALRELTHGGAGAYKPDFSVAR